MGNWGIQLDGPKRSAPTFKDLVLAPGRHRMPITLPSLGFREPAQWWRIEVQKGEGDGVNRFQGNLSGDRQLSEQTYVDVRPLTK